MRPFRAAKALVTAPPRQTIAAVAALLLGCVTATEPPFPAGAERFAPPPQYALWWDMVQQCSGRSTDLANVDWFTLPGEASFQVWGRTFRGYAWRTPPRILLTDEVVSAGPFVRHEMLHVLLDRGGHPSAFFGTRCGGIITCMDSCLDEARVPEPPLDAPTLEASELLVSLKAMPSLPSATLYGGWFALIVEVTNPRPHAVWVNLEPTGPGSPLGKTFGFAAGESTPTYTWDDDLRIGFIGGERKQFAFDTFAPGTSWLDQDTEVRAFFSTKEGPAVTVHVTP